jgi:hypothetical protein
MVKLWRPLGLWDIEFNTFSRQSADRCQWGCQPYMPAALHPGGRFPVLISVRGWVNPRAIVQLEGLGKLKISTSSGLECATSQACSIVPQPTTLLCALNSTVVVLKKCSACPSAGPCMCADATCGMRPVEVKYTGKRMKVKFTHQVVWELRMMWKVTGEM